MMFVLSGFPRQEGCQKINLYLLDFVGWLFGDAYLQNSIVGQRPILP